MPQAFGTFEQSFVLNDCVCSDCNKYFGDTLELRLSRDSMEAVLRLRYGIKSASEAKDLPYKKIELKVGQPGAWFGTTAVLETDSTGQGIEPVPVPQVAFKWKGESEWVWFLEKEMDSTRLARYKDARGRVEIRIFGPSEDDRKRLIEKLREFDIKFVEQGKLEEPITTDGSVGIQIAAQVDATIFRAVAKIAFNYVAYIHGASFVLRSDFDDLRSYIRYGTHSALTQFVRPFNTPILADDHIHLRQTNGHLITFDWNHLQTGLVAQVSMFNTTTYHVLFCSDYSGIWHNDMRTGHHFDLTSRIISPLISASSVIPFIPMTRK